MKYLDIAGYSFGILSSLILAKIAFKLWGPSKYNKYDEHGEVAGVDGCLFCGFVKEMNIKVYEDDQVIAFHDISPYASTHLLVIPRRHIKNLMALKKYDLDLLIHMKSVALQLASQFGNQGCELVFHKPAYNSILHLHLHVMIKPLTRPLFRWIFFNSMFSSTIDEVISKIKVKHN